ncbi:hypothetical protein NKH18_23820 [Streptomyces sp. M10(2022)]
MPSACWLERWRTEAIASGTRALDHHRDGVQRAITTLGTGFLRHPANTDLRENLDADRFHAALLRLAYRMIFLFVAEDRDALHHPTRATTPANGTPSTSAPPVCAATPCAARAPRTPTSMPRCGSSWTPWAVRTAGPSWPARPRRPLRRHRRRRPSAGVLLSNASLLEAVRHLSRVRDEKTARWRPVDYRNMGSEELGSIYESLLELVPKHSATERSFELVNRLGNDRKKTGSYYTPPRSSRPCSTPPSTR